VEGIGGMGQAKDEKAEEKMKCGREGVENLERKGSKGPALSNT